MSSIVDLISATVKLEQPIGTGQSISATGFVVAAKSEDGEPRLILVTANHVLERMKKDEMRVGFRTWAQDQGWRYSPINVRIRTPKGEPVWIRHPTRDVAALELPPGATDEALPLSELPGERALERLKVQPGDEMMVLGYPRGIAANDAGFPILRSGKVASYPLSPADRYPTYLVDFDVFGGNSGGPVYMSVKSAGPADPTVVVTGLLTQQIKYNDLRLAIGNVTQADFISETVSLMGGIAPVQATQAPAAPARSEGKPVPASTSPGTPRERLAEAWKTFEDDLEVLLRRTWIVVRDWWISVTTSAPSRV